MLKNTNQTYGTVSKLLHWSVGLLIIALLAVGLYMVDLPNSDQKWFLYGTHKAVGMIALTLAVIWVFWRLMNKSPDFVKDIPSWQKKVAAVTYLVLFIFMIIMPLSGYLMSVLSGREIDMFGLFSIPAISKEPSQIAGVSHFLHVQLPYFFIGVISLHTLAALYHHFIRKDDTLRLMLPGKND